jgi:hypothetical protein
VDGKQRLSGSRYGQLSADSGGQHNASARSGKNSAGGRLSAGIRIMHEYVQLGTIDQEIVSV